MTFPLLLQNINNSFFCIFSLSIFVLNYDVVSNLYYIYYDTVFRGFAPFLGHTRHFSRQLKTHHSETILKIMTMGTETCIFICYYVLSYNFAFNCPENIAFEMHQG